MSLPWPLKLRTNLEKNQLQRQLLSLFYRSKLMIWSPLSQGMAMTPEAWLNSSMPNLPKLNHCFVVSLNQLVPVNCRSKCWRRDCLFEQIRACGCWHSAYLQLMWVEIYDCKPVAINLSRFAINLSQSTVLFAINLSRKLSCLQAGVFMFASRYIYCLIQHPGVLHFLCTPWTFTVRVVAFHQFYTHFFPPQRLTL